METSGAAVEDYGDPSAMTSEDYVEEDTEDLAETAWRDYGVTGYGNEDMDHCRSDGYYNPSSGDVL